MADHQLHGAWQVLDLGHEGSQILAVHAALLHTGQILYFSGSEHNPEQGAAHDFDHSRIFDPATGHIEHIHSPHFDTFCTGHAFLADGRLLIAGGTERYVPTYNGVRDASIFDRHAPHGQNPWIQAMPMLPERGLETGGGRWYPTLATLPDGRVLAMAGLPLSTDTRPLNIMVEVYSPEPAPHGSWIDMGDLPECPGGYPRLHVLPDGRVFCATPMAGLSRAWDPVRNLWADVGPGAGGEHGSFLTTMVLLPLLAGEGYRARVMSVGAAETKVIDLDHPEHGWQPTKPRALHGSPGRMHACAVLLPDSTVLVVGGSPDGSDAAAVKEAERYDPGTGSWSVLAPAAVPRVYHSVALLLPDGRVWTAGSNHNGAAGHHSRELSMEVYSPPYLFKGDRPVIDAAPESIALPVTPVAADTFTIETAQSAAIDSVALMRCGSVTHAFDVDQRYVGLRIVDRTAGSLTVAAPPSAAVAPPGWYMLFILDASGVPSEARFLRVESLNWSGPRAVPGWFGWETQGADAALADISGTGRPDLVLVHVDNPEGENQAHFRVGWELDPAGNAAAWSDPAPVPGWFGSETAGAGVAVGDVNGSGRPDIVVFHVDNPEGENHAFYRIGWDVDAGGAVTGGWSPVVEVPGWWGSLTQGAGIDLADVNNDGRPDLVMVHVDNAEGENQGFYRIGWDLDAAGAVREWGPIVAIPGRWGPETQGAGVALADLDGNGRPEIVVFHVDNLPGDNHGYYRIGWNLDQAGNVTGDWSGPFPIAGWFGSETAGAGIAAGNVGGTGRPDLVVFHVDNPFGDNQGHYRVLIL